ncbi:hypothetical protein HYALB_00007339 [Hymenoscyphus albidus]|uniref:CsbD-like domain-containing protein n=1 Tax=Hymenoscyphus albidus TaxID=595503 RepID=A0A9N9Q2A9_9HELO|nr:hypothetical protein HYALB_00007339 [Hymenoscyphus albidus]
MSSSTTNNTAQDPSMIAGHAQYAKGYVESTIGAVTGSEEWKKSGEKDMGDGIGTMKEANAQRQGEPAPSGLGKAEEVAGKVAGCEGMEKEGIQRQEKAQ